MDPTRVQLWPCRQLPTPTMSVSVGRIFESVCLFVCPHNSKTNDPKAFKLGTGNWDIVQVTWFLVGQRSTLELGLTVIRRGLELCLLAFDVLLPRRRQFWGSCSICWRKKRHQMTEFRETMLVRSTHRAIKILDHENNRKQLKTHYPRRQSIARRDVELHTTVDARRRIIQPVYE